MSRLRISKEENDLRQRFSSDFKFYAEHCLRIRTKEGGISPFYLNSAQIYIDNIINEQLLTTGKVRIIILKGRQQGCSTYVEGRFYWRVTHRMGTRAFILTHDNDATNNLYDMVQRYHENCPVFVRPPVGTHNAKELNFINLDSGYKIGTAGNKAVGRSNTIQLFHGSEVAFWPNAQEHSAGILQAIPNDPGTEVIFESTANGMGNYFHSSWNFAESKESEYRAVFIPWFWQHEYQRYIDEPLLLNEEEFNLKEIYKLNDNQLAWRRNKIIELGISGINGEKLFKQEYPSNSQEAFIASADEAFIDPIIVDRARKTIVDGYGPIVIGVDPAYKGEHSKDSTAIINRQGRKAFDLVLVKGYDTMEVTGLLMKRIAEIKPSKIFIDSVGIGVGIIDRLRELGYSNLVMPVYSGSNAINQNLYNNKSAEMWGLMLKWLEDAPCQIPDNPILHTQLCSRAARPDSKNRLVLQKKSEAGKSPDAADALGFTFAFPLGYGTQTGEKFYNPAIKI